MFAANNSATNNVRREHQRAMFAANNVRRCPPRRTNFGEHQRTKVRGEQMLFACWRSCSPVRREPGRIRANSAANIGGFAGFFLADSAANPREFAANMRTTPPIPGDVRQNLFAVNNVRREHWRTKSAVNIVRWCSRRTLLASVRGEQCSPLGLGLALHHTRMVSRQSWRLS